jgi:hypothetical protein
VLALHADLIDKAPVFDPLRLREDFLELLAEQEEKMKMDSKD